MDDILFQPLFDKARNISGASFIYMDWLKSQNLNK